MNEKAKDFYGGKVDFTSGRVTLTGTQGICPLCGYKFDIEAPLTPNVTMKEFYGGRIKFFKDVTCRCFGEYRLCIEERYDSKECKNKLNIINMILLKEGVPMEEADKIRQEEGTLEAREIAKERAKELGVDVLPLYEREKIKRQTVLANIVDVDTKIETLCYQTKEELVKMCRQKKIRVSSKDTKEDLAKKLLAKDPTLVVAG